LTKYQELRFSACFSLISRAARAAKVRPVCAGGRRDTSHLAAAAISSDYFIWRALLRLFDLIDVLFGIPLCEIN
jgi:hypothetical protein